jgi:hypothetical protein
VQNQNDELRRREIVEQFVLKLYKFVHISDIESIIRIGIVPKLDAESRPSGFFADISDPAVQARRGSKSITLSDGQRVGLHELVGLYLTPLTPTLYVHSKKGRESDLVFIDIDTKLVSDSASSFAYSSGNAASYNSTFYTDLADLSKMPWHILNAETWFDAKEGGDEGKRLRNSEFLIHPRVVSKYFKRFVVLNEKSRIRLVNQLQAIQSNIPVVIDPSYFFTPPPYDPQRSLPGPIKFG